MRQQKNYDEKKRRSAPGIKTNLRHSKEKRMQPKEKEAVTAVNTNQILEKNT